MSARIRAREKLMDFGRPAPSPCGSRTSKIYLCIADEFDTGASVIRILCDARRKAHKTVDDHAGSGPRKRYCVFGFDPWRLRVRSVPSFFFSLFLFSARVEK